MKALGMWLAVAAIGCSGADVLPFGATETVTSSSVAASSSSASAGGASSSSSDAVASSSASSGASGGAGQGGAGGATAASSSSVVASSSMASSVASSTSASSGAGGALSCNARVNDYPVSEEPCVYVQDYAFAFVPAHSMTLDSIEIHMKQNVGVGAVVDVFDDANGQPGAQISGTKIAMGPPNGVDGWTTFVPWQQIGPQKPIHLTGGITYWIVVEPNADEVHCAASGSNVPAFFRYKHADPWTQVLATTLFTAHVNGSCD